MMNRKHAMQMIDLFFEEYSADDFELVSFKIIGRSSSGLEIKDCICRCDNSGSYDIHTTYIPNTPISILGDN